VGCTLFLCEELLAHGQRWRHRVEHVKSVQALSLQLGLSKERI
jgi:hypothetical protein